MLRQGCHQHISDLIEVHRLHQPGLRRCNRHYGKTAGIAHMGVGHRVPGRTRLKSAAAHGRARVPLLETSINGARGVLLNITGGPWTWASLRMIEAAANLVQEAAPIPMPTSSSAPPLTTPSRTRSALLSSPPALNRAGRTHRRRACKQPASEGLYTAARQAANTSAAAPSPAPAPSEPPTEEDGRQTTKILTTLYSRSSTPSNSIWT